MMVSESEHLVFRSSLLALGGFFSGILPKSLNFSLRNFCTSDA